MTGLRLVFMGTPAFAVPALKALLASPHHVIAAYAQPPRPAGRGLALAKSPVQRLAESKGIPVLTPPHFKDPETRAKFRAHRADAAVVAAYGLILPEAVLGAPKQGCINIHASLLPRWRGAAPIAHAILAGDAETGITLMRMEKGLDTGPILAQERVTITPADTAGTLHDRLAELGALMIVPALGALAKDKLAATPQDQAQATLAPKIAKADCEIQWREPADTIARKVRAFSPAPGAWTTWKGTRLRVLAGASVEGKGKPGEVLDDRLSVACGEGAYRIARLQREGKAPLDAGAFLRGTPVKKGERLA